MTVEQADKIIGLLRQLVELGWWFHDTATQVLLVGAVALGYWLMRGR